MWALAKWASSLRRDFQQPASLGRPGLLFVLFIAVALLTLFPPSIALVIIATLGAGGVLVAECARFAERARAAKGA